MRDVTTTLAASQAAPVRTPYVHCVFVAYDEGESYDYTGRWFDIYHKETEWSGYAYIILQNWDRAVPDLRGFHIDLGWGDVTEAGPEYADAPRLWVKGQNDFSMSGRLYTIVYCEDFWELLDEAESHLGSPPTYWQLYEKDTTVFDLISTMMVAEGVTLNLVGDDTLIDTFMPRFEVNADSYEFYRSVIKRALDLTFCYIRLKAGMTAETVFPQETDTPDVIYYSNKPPFFKEWSGELKEVVPNTINVFGGATFDANLNIVLAEDRHNWSTYVMGTQNDGDSVARYGSRVQSYKEPWFTEENCGNLAASLLSRVLAKTYSGSLKRNNDCRIELYDYVQVYDGRGVVPIGD
jgi:hypothetical protein